MKYAGRVIAVISLVAAIVIGIAQLTGHTLDLSDGMCVVVLLCCLFYAALGCAVDNRFCMDALVRQTDKLTARSLQRRLIAQQKKADLVWYDGICGRIMADRKKGQYKVVHGALRDPKA